jgi:hypothetical protein
VFNPFSVEAFRKGPPKPPNPNLPRPHEPVPESAVLRLAQQGWESDRPATAPVSNSFDSADLNRRLAALRTLRIVQPDERPLAPAVNDWQPVLPPNASSPAATPVINAIPVEPARPVEIAVPALAGVSVDDVLAHMEETLRLIREMRKEKSVTSP